MNILLRHTILVLILCMADPLQGALIVQSYSPERHDRFVNSPEFVGSAFDWSGVGRSNTGAWGTLISPSHVIAASHAPSNGTMRFYLSNDPNGAYVERNVLSGTAIANSDLYLATLDAPITSGVGIFPVAALATTNALLGQTIFTYGLATSGTPQTNMRLGRNTVDSVLPDFSHPNLGAAHGDILLYDFDFPGGLGADESLVQSGDSGAPSFVVVNGIPAVVGVHWFTYQGNTPGDLGSGDTLVSSYIDALNSVMAGEHVTTVTLTAVPEGAVLPCSLLVLGIQGLVRRYRRTRELR